jgi:HSP20 family molecular chaperone IbpA
MADKGTRVQVSREAAPAERPETTRSAPVAAPLADIRQTKDGIVVELDMPSVDPGSINVGYERRTLTVTARGRSTAPAGYSLTHAEYADGDYERTFTVSDLIDANGIDATYRNGVLKLVLPFAKESQARTIKVKTA